MSAQESKSTHPSDSESLPPLNTPIFLRSQTTINPHGESKENESSATATTTAGLDPVSLISMQRVSGATLNPSKNVLVFCVRSLSKPGRFHSENNAKFTQSLYAMNINATANNTNTTNSTNEGLSNYRRLTCAVDRVDSNPIFLDNNTILFLSNRSGSNQLHLIDLNGGESQKLTDFDVSIQSMKFNRAKQFLVFAAEVYPDIEYTSTLELFKLTAERQKSDETQANDYQIFDKLFFRRWDEFTSKRRSHLFLLSLKFHQSSENSINQWSLNGEPIDLLPRMDLDVPRRPYLESDDYSIAPDGTEVAYTTLNNNTSSAAWTTNTRIYSTRITFNNTNSSISASTPQLISLNGNHGYDAFPVYSNNNQHLAYLSMARNQYESDQNRIMLYNRVAGTTQRVGQSFINSPDSLLFTDDGSHLLFTAHAEGHHRIYSLNIQDNNIKPLVTQHSNMALILANNNTFIFERNSFNSPTDLYSMDYNAATNTIKPLTAINSTALSKLEMSAAQSIQFIGGNKESVQAWFFPPVNFNPNQKYPLVSIVHGGPQVPIDSNWHYRWNPQIYTAAGYAVLMVNFHGTPGWGQAFTDSINQNWHTLPYQDIMASIDHILHQYQWIDPHRLSALGASFGGWMMNWLNGHTNRFKCLVTHAGLFSQTSMYYTTEELYFTEWEWQGKPFDSPQKKQLYELASPEQYVSEWTTPTLVTHGGKDYRVPESEGFATFTALQRKGIDSKFIYFKNENHWILKPANSLIWHQNVLEWLKKHLN